MEIGADSSSLRTRLPHVLAALYGLAIVYASLEPFQPWLPPPPNTPFFLFGDSVRWTRNDALLNVIAYVPFGLFVALMRRGLPPKRRIIYSVLIGAAMSFSMESLQMYIPSRVASAFDLAANTAGAALGGILATALARSALTRESIYRTRSRLFLPGHLGDVGLSLMLLWLVAQTNPGIPLFSFTFENEPTPPASATPSLREALPVIRHDKADIVVQAATTSFQVLGVGLFAALLMRQRRRTGTIVAGLILGALMMKSMAAAFMLRPTIWQAWVKPGTLIGVAVGALALRVAIMLPRPVQVAACAIALLSSLGAPVLAPETLAARAPAAIFDWHFGQLMNYNGLTRAALLVWPVLTAVWLFALAGKPAWGKPPEPA
jgi:VanZ family protein